MKGRFVKIIALTGALLLLAFTLISCGGDPNVAKPDESGDGYVVETAADGEQKLLDGFHAYGSGKTDPITVNGVTVDVGAFAVRGYEFAYMIAQKDFASPKDLPIDAVVQYAFSHVFFKDLHSITNKEMQYRSATEQEVKDVLKAHFGSDDFDIKSSVLYNPGKKIFEMWIPEYGTNIFYNVDSVDEKSDGADIRVTYYNELGKETLLGREIITVKIKDGKACIDALKSD